MEYSTDQFWVVFTRPGQFYLKDYAAFLAKNAQHLGLPGQQGNRIGLFAFTKYNKLGKQYLKAKLVAGLDVYGAAGLQIASRTYMGLLRQDAEEKFQPNYQEITYIV